MPGELSARGFERAERAGQRQAIIVVANRDAIGPCLQRRQLHRLVGRVLGAREAYDKGLVTRVVADGGVEKEAYATAARIAAGGPNAARATKRWVRRLSVAPAPLTEAEVREHFAFFDSDEYREGVRSFLAKTKPNFN